MKLKIGDKAPSFSLPNQDGNLVTLESLIKNGVLVLYFYPKDDTPGCTAEACKFRDDYEIFKDNGAEVVGISSDSKESHIEFIKNHNLPFQLLSDKNGKIRKKFAVPKTFGLIAGRVTYIINSNGRIIHIFNSQFNPQKHIDEAITVIKKNN
ncbi:MAG: peroxiredoxin [Bacteroidetes bacterium]|nr:MAG: peroxiredoxin [Bacteroidota bacterium]